MAQPLLRSETFPLNEISRAPSCLVFCIPRGKQNFKRERETFFFFRPAKNFMPLADTETHTADHCARRDAERTACPFAEGTPLLSNNHIQPQRICILYSRHNSPPTFFFHLLFFSVVSVLFHYFLSLAHGQCETIVANEVALRLFGHLFLPDYTIGRLSLDRRLLGYQMLISRICCAIMVRRQAVRSLKSGESK